MEIQTQVSELVRKIVIKFWSEDSISPGPIAHVKAFLCIIDHTPFHTGVTMHKHHTLCEAPHKRLLDLLYMPFLVSMYTSADSKHCADTAGGCRMGSYAADVNPVRSCSGKQNCRWRLEYRMTKTHRAVSQDSRRRFCSRAVEWAPFCISLCGRTVV